MTPGLLTRGLNVPYVSISINLPWIQCIDHKLWLMKNTKQIIWMLLTDPTYKPIAYWFHLMSTNQPEDDGFGLLLRLMHFRQFFVSTITSDLLRDLTMWILESCCVTVNSSGKKIKRPLENSQFLTFYYLWVCVWGTWAFLSYSINCWQRFPIIVGSRM